MTHDELRQRNRKLRAEISQEDLLIAANSLFQRIVDLPEFQQAEKIAVYFAVNGEISLDPVIDHVLSLGKKIYLPSAENQHVIRFV